MLIVSRVHAGSFMAKVSQFQKGYYAVVTDLSNEVLWTQEVNSIEIAKEKAFSMAKNFEVTRKYLFLSEQYHLKSQQYYSIDKDKEAFYYFKKAIFYRQRAIVRRFLDFWFEDIPWF